MERVNMNFDKLLKNILKIARVTIQGNEYKAAINFNGFSMNDIIIVVNKTEICFIEIESDELIFTLPSPKQKQFVINSCEESWNGSILTLEIKIM